MELPVFLQTLLFCAFLIPCKGTLTGPSQRDEMVMTDDEAAQFEQFKAAVLPSVKNNWLKLDIGLIKYFTQAGRNALAATALFKEGLKLRLDSDDYKISDEVRAYGDWGIPRQILTDKFGRLVSYYKITRANVSLAITNDTAFTIAMQYIWASAEGNMEWLANKHETRKNFAYGVLVDFKDGNPAELLSPKGIEMFTTLVKETEIRFPRCWQFYMIVNAPPSIDMPLAVIKNAMSEDLKALLLVYSEDDTVWAPIVSQFMDIDQIKDLYRKSKDVGAAPAPAEAAPPKAALPAIPGAEMGRKMMPFGSPFGAAGAGEADAGAGNKKGKKKKKKAKKEEDDYDQE